MYLYVFMSPLVRLLSSPLSDTLILLLGRFVSFGSLPAVAGLLIHIVLRNVLRYC